MSQVALLEVRLVPWRPRARVMKADTLRHAATDPLGPLGDGVAGALVGLAVWLLIVIAAPLLVLVLAAVLLSVEWPVVLGLALLVLIARFTGLIPWTVVILDPTTGTERRESYRILWHAVSRIRAVSHDHRVKVRWAWT